MLLDSRNNKFILNSQKGHREMDKNKKVVYSFGYPYKYGDSWTQNEWYIPEKYNSFKEEMLAKVSPTDWDQWMMKADEHHDTRHCKKIDPYLGDPISVDHVLAVMVYCGDDVKFFCVYYIKPQ